MKRRTEEERRKILQGLLAGRYTPLLKEDQLRFCAGLHMKAILELPLKERQQIGALLGDNTKTIGSRVVAGVGPLYGEILIVQKDDWKVIIEAYNKELEHLQAVKVS